MAEKSIVGDLINFRGLVYAPINENGVVFLFGKVAHDLNMYVEEIKPGFPDCIARRFIGKGWERVRIEFEYKSSNFQLHGHDSKECDIVICWEHDWKDCPIEVIELRSEIRGLENPPIARPEAVQAKADNLDDKVAAILKNAGANQNVGRWFGDILAELKKQDDSIWANAGEKFIGLYSPEKAFASVKLQATSIRIECFSRGEPLSGTKVSNDKLAPRWAKFSVKSDHDAKGAVQTLTESLSRLQDAIKNGEPTAYFSGGEFATAPEDGSSDEDDS